MSKNEVAVGTLVGGEREDDDAPRHTTSRTHGVNTPPAKPTKKPEIHRHTGVDVKPGWVVILSFEPHLHILSRLGPAQIKVGGHYGGWEVQERPRRKPLTWYKGQGQETITIDVMINRFERQLSVEDVVRRLEKMAQPNNPHAEPPRVVWDTGGMQMHDFTHNPNKDWVIMDLDFGDAEWSTGHRYKTRQQVTVTLGEYIEDRHVEALKHKRKKSRYKRYRIKQGDTLRKIAAKFLGSGKRWHEIARMNKIRDPNHLKVGTVILIPPMHQTSTTTGAPVEGEEETAGTTSGGTEAED